MNIDEAFDSYIDYLKFERNASLMTIHSYSIDIGELGFHLEQMHISSVRNIDENCLRIFLSDLYEKKIEKNGKLVNLSKSTVERKISAVKSFFKYLFIKKIIDVNPAKDLKYPRKDKHVVTIFSEDDIDKLLDSPDVNSATYHRDRLIFELLYGTGIRVGELTAINIGDIYFAGMQMKIKGKGKKERILPLSDYYVELLRDYLDSIKKMLYKGCAVKSEALILNRQGGRLSSRNTLELVKKHLKKAGLPEFYSPHSFRHTFASHLVSAGADIRSVQKLLGHESLAATQKYVNLDLKALIDIYKRAHPKGDQEEV